MKTGVTNTLTSGLAKLAKKLPKAIENAAGVSGLALIDDSLNQDPTPPIDTGYLRGSWFVYVNGKKKKGGKDAGQIPESINVDASKITATVGFSAEYAAAQHQNLAPAGSWQPGPKSQTAGNTGGNFMGAKMERNKDRYAQVFADRLKKAIAGLE